MTGSQVPVYPVSPTGVNVKVKEPSTTGIFPSPPRPYNPSKQQIEVVAAIKNNFMLTFTSYF